MWGGVCHAPPLGGGWLSDREALNLETSFDGDFSISGAGLFARYAGGEVFLSGGGDSRFARLPVFDGVNAINGKAGAACVVSRFVGRSGDGEGGNAFGVRRWLKDRGHHNSDSFGGGFVVVVGSGHIFGELFRRWEWLPW